MFSIPDVGILAVLALLVFGPERLPKLMRQAGRVTRELQATSQTFLSEMERAADVSERREIEPREDEPPLPDDDLPPPAPDTAPAPPPSVP